LTDFGCGLADKDYDVAFALSILPMRAANRVRLHGSPVRVGAMDEVQGALNRRNRPKTESEQNAAAVSDVSLKDLVKKHETMSVRNQKVGVPEV
jgi:hypothetical protein